MPNRRFEACPKRQSVFSLSVRETVTRRNSRRSYGLVVLASIVLIPTCALGQEANDWPAKMFDSLSHDFGVVAKGTQVSHCFKVTNVSPQDVHIASVTASCGCTTPKCDQMLVRSHDSTSIEVSMDTNRFQRQKTSTVTVTFDRPQQAVVTIPVKVYIRPDIVVSPSSINFGAVLQGTSPERQLSIAYTGRPDWKITGAVTNDRHLTARVVQTDRAAGQVHYDLFVRLGADAPIGNLRQQLTLLTDEANCRQIPIPLQASIEADLTVTPSIVQLGSLAPGTQTVKTIVIRGREPFVIKKIECASGPQAFKAPSMNKLARPLHVLTLTFIAPQRVGAFFQRFVVTIPGHTPLEFTARGVVERFQQTSLSK